MGTHGVKWVQLFLNYLHPWSPILCAIHCRMALKRLTEKYYSCDDFNREKVVLIFPHRP